MATISVTNAAEFKLALSAAKDGDVLVLRGGNYGDVTLSGVSFSSGVTIRSAEADAPATFHSLSVVGSRGLDFVGVNIDFTPTASTLAHSSALKISKSSDVSFTDGKIEGGPAVNGVSQDAPVGTSDGTGNVLGLYTGRGVTIEWSEGVAIQNTEISALMKGVVLTEVSGLRLVDNEIHHTRTGMITGTDVSNAVIEGNNIYSSNPHNFSGAGDHADFIHLWTDPARQTSASENITIRNNLIEQDDGQAILGIYLDDNGNGLGFKNVIISNNAILNGNYQGMRLENVFDSSVTNNTLLQTSGEAKTAPAILLRNGSHNIDIHDNILAGIDVKGNGDVVNAIGHNTIAQTANASAAGYYTSQLIAQLGALPNALGAYAAALDQLAGGAGAGKPLPIDPVVPPTSGAGGGVQLGGLVITGGGGADNLRGGAGADTLHGGAGADTLSGGGGDDVLNGGSGDDLYYVDSPKDVIVELAGGGHDTVGSSANYTLGANIEDLRLSNGATIGTGNELGNRITATDANSTLSGLGGNDTLIGRNGHDQLLGGDGDDLLQGQAGNDSLAGGAGDDRLVGGTGSDTLVGGAGADTFVLAPGDILSRADVDVILDFSRLQGDKISLSAIDANIHTVKNEAFAFIGRDEFSARAGELRYEMVGGNAIASADIDGDGIGDFSVQINGLNNLLATDFIL